MTYNGGNSLNTSEQATGKTPQAERMQEASSPTLQDLIGAHPSGQCMCFLNSWAHRKGGDAPRFPGYTGNIGE